MLVNFKNTFKKNKKSTIVPSILIKHLNNSLPTGYEYKSTKDGELVLTAENNIMNLGGFIFNLNESQKKVLGKKYSLDDVLKYSYNSQEPISLKLEKKGYVKLDGKEIEIKLLHYDFFNPIKFDEKSIKMYPYEFPNPFVLTFGNDIYNKEIKIRRIPNKSINVYSFCSVDDESLIIKYTYDTMKNKLDLNFSFDLNNAKSIDEIIITLELYNSFIDGNIKINNQIIQNVNSGKDEDMKIKDTAIIFWKRTKAIEKLLKVSFDLNNFTVTDEIYSSVNELYANLLLEKPIREKNTINSINGQWTNDQIKEMNLSIGQSLYFEFEAKKEFLLFNRKVVLHSLVNIFNSKIKEITSDTIILEDENEEKSRFTSSMCFLSYNDMKAFQNKDTNERITLFYNAKSFE